MCARRWSLAVALAACTAAYAAPHRYRLFPNASIVVLGMTEDPAGFLWLAAEDGAYRFDGFHFRKAAGFPFPSAHFAAATRDGAIWMGGADGLARWHGGSFQVVQRERVNALAATPDYIVVKNGPVFRRFSADGSSTVLHRDAWEQISSDPFGGVWFSSMRMPRAVLVDPALPGRAIETVSLPESFEQVARARDGNVWAAHGAMAIAVAGPLRGRTVDRRPSRKTARPYPLMGGRSGHLWFIGEVIERLGATPLEFRDGPANAQRQPTCAFEDSRGRLWAAVLGVGLVEWTPDLNWNRWASDEPVAQVAEAPDGTVVAATRAGLSRFDQASDSWRPLAGGKRDFAAIASLPGFGWLASIRRLGVARIGPGGGTEALANPLPSPDQYRILRRDAEGRYWVGNKAELFRVEDQSGRFRLAPEDLPGVREGQFAQPVDLDVDGSGRLWAGYAEGLAWRDAEGRWTRIATDQPVREIRSFALGPGGSSDEIWVAYRRGGRFSRLTRAGSVWHVKDFTPGDGYGPTDTHFIKRDSRGWIWRGAPDGVRVSDGSHVAPNDWIHLAPSNGLSTASISQYGFHEGRDGTIWISGEEGITRLRPDPSWFQVPSGARPPKVLAIYVDGRERPVSSGEVQLPAGARDVRMEIGSLDAPPFRDAPFRYRLLSGDSEWKLSADGTLEFRELPARAYTLELAFASDGGPQPVTFRFRIGPPPLNLAWLFVPPVAAGAGALVLFGPWFWWSQKNRYRVSKWVFLLRRRLRSERYLDGQAAAGHDYAGQVFLERYQLTEPVSQGGFSVVYEGRDLSRGGARIAVKVLLAPPGAETWLGARFAHEIAALRTLRNPAVVDILDSWIAPGGEPCLAMPFLEGPTLRQALRDGPLMPWDVARLTVLLADALGDMHARGIVHRDLKPENVMFAGRSFANPVIIDFGTASLRARADRANTTTLVAGSVRYMAPERMTGRFSPATDVFGLGLIALECLTGSTLGEFSAAVGEPGFESELAHVLSSLLPGYDSRTIASLLVRACAPQPQGRPADIRAWARELAGALAPA